MPFDPDTGGPPVPLSYFFPTSANLPPAGAAARRASWPWDRCRPVRRATCDDMHRHHRTDAPGRFGAGVDRRFHGSGRLLDEGGDQCRSPALSHPIISTFAAFSIASVPSHEGDQTFALEQGLKLHWPCACVLSG